MAFLKSNIEFTGSIGNITAYELPNVDGIVVRTQGGGNKKKLQSSPSCGIVWLNATEYGLCGKMGGSIRRSMIQMIPVADYNFVSDLNAIAKKIQLADTTSTRGERGVPLSAHKDYLRGFSLNKTNTFESIVRLPFECHINRESGIARVKLPELTPGINLTTSKQYPLFRFLVNLGCVADRHFSANKFDFVEDLESVCVYTSWHHTQSLFEARELSIELKDPTVIVDTTTLILSVGIQMGNPVSYTFVSPAKHGGCAKIIAVA